MDPDAAVTLDVLEERYPPPAPYRWEVAVQEWHGERRMVVSLVAPPAGPGQPSWRSTRALRLGGYRDWSWVAAEMLAEVEERRGQGLPRERLRDRAAWQLFRLATWVRKL